MLNSLRSRLLLSYLIVIGTVLAIVALALLAVSAAQSVRVVPVLRQLNTIGLGLRREVAVMVERGATLPTIQRALNQAASDQDVRILILNRESQSITYDSYSGAGNWVGRVPGGVQRPSDAFVDLDPNLPVGRYRAPDGSRWLMYSLPFSGRPASRLILLVARPEPTVFGYFREAFLRPICQAGLIAMLLSITLAWLISRSVARPLQDLATAAEGIAQGNYDQRLPLRGPDEVLRVADSFNTMSTQVSAAQQSQRDFVANVSHDLKTPLTSIRGWSQAILDGTADSEEEQRQAAEVIHSEAGRMERLVDQLLDLARIESGQLVLNLESVDLERLLGEVRERFAERADQGHIDLQLEIKDVPQISGDSDRLIQIMNNLVENAIAHTPPRGQITVGLQPFGRRAVELRVQDSGTGIAAKDLDRIFERFYQTDKARVSSGGKGSGLGLAIVRELAEAHGGSITAQSAIGRGSTFTIHLPVDGGANHRLAGNPSWRQD